MGKITMNKQELSRLKRYYRRAIRQGKTKFTFQGHVLLVAFAKYYIEYIETVVLKGQA